MARALSLDLRIRVAAALAGGSTVREAAKRFGVSVASAVWIGQLARSGHGLAARKVGGNRQPRLLGATEALTNRLAAKSDWTVRALAADLKAGGIDVSHDTVWRFMRRQGLTFKNVWPAPSARVFTTWSDQSTPTYPTSETSSRPRWRSARPGPHKTRGVERHFLNQGSRTPVDCQAISLPPPADLIQPSAPGEREQLILWATTPSPPSSRTSAQFAVRRR